MRSRRSFLTSTSQAAAFSLFMPSFGFNLLGKHKDPIIGHGDFRYRFRSQWGSLDATKYPVKDCHEMVQDRQGRLIMLGTEIKNNVLIYDRSGKLLDSWGTGFPGGHGLTLVEEGEEEFLWITDYLNNEVYKTTLDGRIILTLGWPEDTGLYEKKSKYHPTETAVAPNGDLYIADGYGRQYIHRYNQQGQYLGYFGGPGWLWQELMAKRYPDKLDWSNQDHDPHLLNNAHGVTVDLREPKQPTLLVSSRMDNALKRFSLEGEYLSQIDVPGAFLNRAVIQGEYVYAAVLRSDHPSRDRTGFVTILDGENKVVSNPGGTRPRYKKGMLKQIEQAKPLFIHPHDVCVDSDENLYIPQWNADQVYPIMLERV